MDNLPETYNDPQFYMTIVSNFSWVLQSGPKRGRGQWLCLFFFFLFFWRGRDGGYRTWTMVSVKIVNMVKMSWVKSGNQNRIRFILPMQKAAINILSQAKLLSLVTRSMNFCKSSYCSQGALFLSPRFNE